MKLALELNALEMRQAVTNGVLLGLAEACLGLEEQKAQTPIPAAPAPVVLSAPAPAPVAPAPTPAPAPAPTPAPVAPAPAAVPTAQPATYTLDQIVVAGAALMDADKTDQLLALLAKYGVNALTQLPPEQYGAIATELRALGAQI